MAGQDLLSFGVLLHQPGRTGEGVGGGKQFFCRRVAQNAPFPQDDGVVDEVSPPQKLGGWTEEWYRTVP